MSTFNTSMIIKHWSSFILMLFVTTIHAQTNYSNIENWAAHPLKHDASDSISKSLRTNFKQDTLVDIFFIHPTTYTSSEKEFGLNADVENVELNNKTDNSTILYQASVFNASGNVYAPRYRQAHLHNYFPLTKEDTINAVNAFELAYEDVKAAFEFYLLHYNNGKPIVIASHSQGTTHAKRLMKEFFDGKILQEKLVVAYLVGMPVEYNWFSNIPACSNPKQTGCFCSWRTFKDGYKPEYIENEKDSIIVTNPLTWDVSKPVTSREDNPGTILRNFNKIKTGIVNANVVDHVLWSKKPRFFGNIFLTTKNYHIADYNFFYMSIRENVKERIESYLLTSQSSN